MDTITISCSDIIQNHQSNLFLEGDSFRVNWISPRGIGFTYLDGIGKGGGNTFELRTFIDSISDSPTQYNLKMEEAQNMNVNPESITCGDIISTPHGISRVGWVSEEKGFLSYSPLSDLTDRTYSKEIPIRSARLLSRSASAQGDQLSLPFITEMVEQAIMERNARLDELRSETFSPKVTVRSKSPKGDTIRTGDSKEDANLLKALSKLSKEDLLRLLD